MKNSLCIWISKGCTYKDACAMEGVSFQTFNEWRKEKNEFSESIKKAEIECKQRRISTILKASSRHWQAAAWFLERRYPHEYGKEAATVEQHPPIILGFKPQSHFIQPTGAKPQEMIATSFEKKKLVLPRKKV